MIVGEAGQIGLAIDLSGSGSFRPAGIMRSPDPVFAAALNTYLGNRASAEKDYLLFYAAALASGRCSMTGPESSGMIADCLQANLIAEWRLSIPDEGHIRALYLVTGMRQAGDALGLVDLTLRLSGKPSFEAFKQEN
jgi:hypothetical protein